MGKGDRLQRPIADSQPSRFPSSRPDLPEHRELALSRLIKKRSSDEQLTDQDLRKLANRIFESRRLRAQFLSTSLLGEPVWDMLLALYSHPSRDEGLSVGELCLAAAVPAPTALRWARVIEQKNLISRTKHPKDRRRAIVTLTDEGELLMRGYLASVRTVLGD